VWEEIWPDIGPRIETVLQSGEATWDEALLLFLARSGYPEETYHTFSYSPLADDDGAIVGMLCVVTEDTERVIGERRLALLRDVAAGLASTSSEAEVFAALEASLAADGRDLPISLIYLFEPDGTARLVVTAGIPQGHPAAPPVLQPGDPASVWPSLQLLASGASQRIADLKARCGELPGGAWGRPVDEALLLPLGQQGQERPAGFLVAGLNPFRRLDADYDSFLKLLAGQIASGIGNARAYEAERQRAEALAELDRAKTAFFSNVSHEFRTPLTLMLGPIADALADAESPAERERLELLHRNALRLQRLVNSLLDFSRIEAGRVRAVYVPTDLPALTAELASVFRSTVESAGLRLDVDCGQPLSEPVYVDREMWEKIVLNLLSNAFKFTFEGEIGIRIREAAGGVELTVSDSGIGIPPEELPRLFERFHRVEGARGRTHEGTGIGLALVQELVRLHGGTVHVSSETGVGTTFTISLPRGTAHLPADRIDGDSEQNSTTPGGIAFVEEAFRWLPEAPETTEPVSDLFDTGERPHVEPSVRRARVLLADDNADMREYLRRLLSNRYEVEAVPDGDAALAVVRRQPPDLLLSDVMMPGLDGFGLLRELRANPETATIPVVLLSARAGEEARLEGLGAGADDYLIKPFSARELLGRVASQLELARVRFEAGAALRESEERFRNMADHSPLMLWVTDAAGMCTYLNARWYEFTGQTPEEGLGYGWLEAVHPEDQPAAGAMFLAANESAQSFQVEYRLRRRDGEYRWAIDAAAPRISPDGEFHGYVGSVIDITERKLAEEELVDAARRKDEFLAMLAHELRNPLSPIATAAAILKRQLHGDQRLRRQPEIIERQIRTMSRLLDDLLDISRITRGKVLLQAERLDACALLQAALESSGPYIRERAHELSVSLPEGPMWVEGDPVRIEQILCNLLNNAARYTDPHGRIEVSLERNDGEHRAEFRVRDTGIGIAPELLPEVFDLFTQGERSLDRSQGGLGIGLTLVKTLVEMHGGNVHATSAGLGQGSEFCVQLPLLEPGPPQGRSSAGGRTAARNSEDPGTKRVLVVDDNKDAADLLAELVEMWGYAVRRAYSGMAGLELAQTWHPHLVLLDLGMPGMDGYEVARRLRESGTENGPVLVAVSGYGQEEHQQLGREAGFDHHLTKPADAERLEQLLEQELSSSDGVVE
jgi:PAS domain S-box-containing protein